MTEPTLTELTDPDGLDLGAVRLVHDDRHGFTYVYEGPMHP